MHNQIRLSYLNDGKEFDFLYDITDVSHKVRIMNTIIWATKNDIDLVLSPVRQESKVPATA